MRKLFVSKKTGYLIKDTLHPVIIRDQRGLLFYSTEAMEGRTKVFNLPPGIYFVDQGTFNPMPFPVNFPMAKLPPKERNYKPPFDFKVMFGNNPNKCTIRWAEKTIFFDRKLKDITIPELWFILFHEYAHAVYKTERYADLLSGNLMKQRGFNPSQIGTAPLTSLSSAQFERKKHMVKQVIKAYGT